MRVAAGNGDADAPERSFWQTVAFEFFPGCAAVGGFVKSAAGTAAIERPGSAAGLPERGEEDVRIGGIEGDVNRARFVVEIENFLPGFAAVGGSEDAAIGIGSIGVAERGDEKDIR